MNQEKCENCGDNIDYEVDELAEVASNDGRHYLMHADCALVAISSDADLDLA
jgi:hypothetical protein